jgi:flagellar hook-associated protein 3 FlgL
MRITNNYATQRAIAEFAVARSRMDEAQAKVTSGYRFQTASEDPTAASSVMANAEQLGALTQYQRNISSASARSALEENVTDQLTSLLTRAKELALGQATDTATAATRLASGQEVNQLLSQAVQLANTKNGDEYLFGGDASTTVPFSVNATGSAFTFSVAAVPPSGARQVEIGAGQRVYTNHDGTQLFGTATAGPLKALQDLAAALATGLSANVTGAIPALDAAIDGAQQKLAETGARANQLQIADANLTALSNQLKTFNSDLRDVDLETAMTELTGRQTAYQAAMLATSKVLGLSLTEYMR